MDGAKAWLYGRDLYPNAHHLVVLDRREADLDEAAEEVRRALRLRREAGMAILPPLPPPLCESVDVLRR